MPAAEEPNGVENVTAISEASSHFRDNIKQLTPIEDLQTPKYHDKDYLDTVISKASRGDTFFPESVDRNATSTHNTPLFRNLPPRFDYNASTPLKGKQPDPQDGKPTQFQLSQNLPRNIFNLSPEFVSHQPALKLSTNNDGTINPVKGAFNLFDKTASFASGNNSSLGSRSLRRTKKRLRSANMSDLSFDLSNNSSRLTFPNSRKIANDSITMSNSNLSRNKTSSPLLKQQRMPMSRYEYLHSIISDPQCISNLTLLIQIFLNTLMVLVFLGFSMVAFFAIKRDVDHKIASYVNDVIHKINLCKREYLRNNCAPEMRVPALEYKCNEWDTCMSQDPQSVITSMAYFEVLADCMNAFFHNVSMKSLLGIGCLMLFCIIVPNILFSKFRSTTIHQNYYNNNNEHNNSDMLSIQTSSPLKIANGDEPQRVSRPTGNNSFSTPSPDKVKKSTINNDSHNNGNISGSVRFNPNVSYSMYDYEDDNNDKGSPGRDSNAVNNDKYDGNDEDDEDDEDDENLPANQRILLEED